MSETLNRILLDSSVRILFASLAVGLLLRLCRQHSSELRHTVWTMVMCAMLSMPLLTFVLPALPLTFRIPSTAPTITTFAGLQGPQPAASERAVFPTGSVSGQSPFRGTTPGTTTSLPSVEPLSWSSLLVAGYVAGVGYLLMRLILGWFGMKRILQSSTRVAIPGTGPIYQSDCIATPVTVGILRPRILLPGTWRAWTKRDLQAILAHEFGHIRRHDLLTSLLSRINCCVFWFHPLSWWVDHRLTMCAEEACDTAALRVIDSPQRYAEILVGMAKAVHQRGARLSWTAAGMNGNGSLAKRIDRIVSGKISNPVSGARKVWITFACGALILVIAACRQQALPTVAEEQDALTRVQAKERKQAAIVAASQAKERRIQSASTKASNLTAAQAAGLEAQLAKDPDKFETRLELLQFYYYPALRAGMDTATIVKHRREHILWFIRSRPDDELASSPSVFINTDGADRIADPDGYQQGKALWLTQVDKNPSSAAVLGNAAYFTQTTDKKLAETLMLKAQRLQPDESWTEKLAALYASMILRTAAIRPPPFFIGNLNFTVLSVNPAAAHNEDAARARRLMDETKDSTLLLNVGRMLLRVRNLNLGFDPVPLGTQYLQRAETLSPSYSEQAQQARAERARITGNQLQARIHQLPKEGRYEAAMALSDRDRFELFWELAVFSYGYGNALDSDHRSDALREWERAAKYATELASVAGKFRNDPEYGNTVFKANLMLAFVQSMKGDTRGTIDFLHQAVKAPSASKGGDWPSLWTKICPGLLAQGHRDEVIGFLEHFAQIDPGKRDDLLAAVAQLRNGQTPIWWKLS